MFQVGEEQYRKLDIFHIYFDSATYDKIERDVKNSLEDQLGVVGGTLGLFTGFSLISGIEVVSINLVYNFFIFQLLYFIVNMVLSLIKDPKKRRKTQS